MSKSASQTCGAWRCGRWTTSRSRCDTFFWVSSAIKSSNSLPIMTTCQVSHPPLTPYVMSDLSKLHALDSEHHTRQLCTCWVVVFQVRAAAVTLARALRGLTLRVTDRVQSSEGDAAAAVAVALPLLLEKGNSSPRLLSASCPSPRPAAVLSTQQQAVS